MSAQETKYVFPLESKVPACNARFSSCPLKQVGDCKYSSGAQYRSVVVGQMMSKSCFYIPSGNQTWQGEILSKWRFDWDKPL